MKHTNDQQKALDEIEKISSILIGLGSLFRFQPSELYLNSEEFSGIGKLMDHLANVLKENECLLREKSRS